MGHKIQHWTIATVILSLYFGVIMGSNPNLIGFVIAIGFGLTALYSATRVRKIWIEEGLVEEEDDRLRM